MKPILPKKPAGLKIRFLRKLFLSMLLIVVVTGSQIVRSQTNAYSTNFQSLLNQIQMLYCQSNGYDFNQIRSKYPVTFTTILGHALRQQLLQTQRDQGLKPAYDQLEQEAKRYLSDSFRQYQYRFDNGQPMQELALWQFVQDGINGLNDATVMRDFRVAQGSMPLVLAADGSGGTAGGIAVGKLHTNKPKEKNAIILMGVEAPEVRGETPVFLGPDNPAPQGSESSFELDKPMPASTENSFELDKPMPASTENSFELNK
jgi:hypothetical protein